MRRSDSTATRVAGVVVRDGSLLLVHRSPLKRYYPGVWDLFGGHVEGGESPEDALQREAREELGIVVLAAGRLGQIYDPVEPAVVDVYAVSSWEGEPVNAAPEEHTEIRWFDAGELPESEALEAYGTLLVTPAPAATPAAHPRTYRRNRVRGRCRRPSRLRSCRKPEVFHNNPPRPAALADWIRWCQIVRFGD